MNFGFEEWVYNCNRQQPDRGRTEMQRLVQDVATPLQCGECPGRMGRLYRAAELQPDWGHREVPEGRRAVVGGYASLHPSNKSHDLGWSNTDLEEMRTAQNPGRGRNSKDRTHETVHWNLLWITVPASCSCFWLYNTWCNFQADLIYQSMYSTS